MREGGKFFLFRSFCDFWPMSNREEEKKEKKLFDKMRYKSYK